jgi:hypothetical protein
MAEYKIVNGVKMELTPEEMANKLEQQEDWEANKEIYQLAKLRQQRNKLLAESDWTQIPDCTVDQAAWATYRQALRDLPENTADVFNPVYPTKPE